MMTHGLKERLPAAKRLFGTHITLSDPEVSAVLSRAGFDFVLLEADNTEASYSALRNHLAALRTGGVPALVRVSLISENHINRVLELGPHGIIFSGLNTADQVRRAVSMSLYPPEGTRHFNPLRSVTYKIEEAYELAKGENESFCRMIQLDTAELSAILPKLSVKVLTGFFWRRRPHSPDGSPRLFRPDTGMILGAAELLGKADTLGFHCRAGAGCPNTGSGWAPHIAIGRMQAILRRRPDNLGMLKNRSTRCNKSDY